MLAVRKVDLVLRLESNQGSACIRNEMHLTILNESPGIFVELDIKKTKKYRKSTVKRE